MTNYGKQHASAAPKDIEITSTAVFLASDIAPVTHTIEGHTVQEYEYTLVQYTKDEYIAKLAADNAALQQQVLETQEALCDLYESLEGGE